MDCHILSPNTQAILLLCGTLGQNQMIHPKPLSPVEYHNFAKWLEHKGLRPKDLFQPKKFDNFEFFEGAKLDPNRVHSLLNRGGGLALSVEAWINKGLWILSLDDRDYPRCWKDRLDRLAPPILYGAGNQTLLSKGGLAIVGSRDVDEDGLDATHRVANICAIRGIQIITGGARGVDNEAMLTALSQGGTVVGVLTGSLSRESVSGKYRQALRDGKLALISPYDPSVAFNVGRAMGRNKLVYCLSDNALVISSDFNKGGTWAGAVEDLKHNWVPLFVRDDNNSPEGNHQLIELGGKGININSLADIELIKKLGCQFSDMSGISNVPEISETQTNTSNLKQLAKSEKFGAIVLEGVNGATSLCTAYEQDLFTLVWPRIEKEIQKARTDKELASIFNVQKGQMHAWLERAVKNGKAHKQARPTKYIAIKGSLQRWTTES